MNANTSLPFISKLGLAGQVEQASKEIDSNVNSIAFQMDQINLGDIQNSHGAGHDALGELS